LKGLLINAGGNQPVRQLVCHLAAIAVLAGLPKPTHASIPQFEQIYVFGDSLSDTGNVFKATEGMIPPSPPYGQGRFSNGPVWVEYLASQLGAKPQTTNFAFGGATTGVAKTSNLDGTLQIPGLLSQIEDFTAAHSNANPSALYVVWAGANDYLGDATSPAVPLDNLSKAVRTLAAAGARNILIVNLPDLGKLPATRNRSSASTLTRLTQAHNSGLLKILDKLNQSLGPEVNLTLLDVNALFNQAIAEPGRLGFTNATAPCLDSSVVCDTPDKFLFWDGLHPTTAAHQTLGTLALDALIPASIAEPLVECSVLAFGTGVALFQGTRSSLKRQRSRQQQLVNSDRSL